MLDTSECQKPCRIPGVSPGGFRLAGIRSSKFKHVFGSPFKRQRCYDNVKITRNAHDSGFCAANPKFLVRWYLIQGGDKYGSFIRFFWYRLSWLRLEAEAASSWFPWTRTGG